jgi:osmoprotectant transport system permease protein
MNAFFQFLYKNSNQLLEQTLEHIGLTLVSLFLAVLVAVPAGIFVARKVRFAPGTIGFAGILQTIPSIALLGFLIPLLGIGVKPAIFALFLYALLPILRNTFTGIQEVDPAVTEAARGMGMTPRQILRQVELPLAIPVIFAGIRTATVINVGVATLAAYIGGGGLGEFIFNGISLNNSTMILAGAIPSALLAIIFDQLLAALQRLPVRKMMRWAALGFGGLVTLLLIYFLPGLSTSAQAEGNGLRAAFDHEFVSRKDGYPSVQEKYNLSFSSVTTLDANLMYNAIEERKVDLIVGYTTDGRIKSYGLYPLEDDQHAFPPYHCTPIIRPGLTEEFPEVADAVNMLAGRLNDSLMTELNYRVDEEGQTYGKVAEQFLKEIGLWRPDRAQGGRKFVIGCKKFTEQFILAELFGQLINGYTDFDVDMKLGLGGTKICFEALKTGELDVYPEYTGTGFIVILDPPEEKVKSLFTDSDAIYKYCHDEFLEQYGIKWLAPFGFNNTFALMVPKEKAIENNWRKVSDLPK